MVEDEVKLTKCEKHRQRGQRS